MGKSMKKMKILTSLTEVAFTRVKRLLKTMTSKMNISKTETSTKMIAQKENKKTKNLMTMRNQLTLRNL
jgi:hypothetical protein